jgi:hypothetical protein
MTPDAAGANAPSLDIEYSRVLRRRKAILLLLMVCFCLPVLAQKKVHEKNAGTPEKDRAASDAHSFVEMFTKLENGAASAVQHKDGPALEAILASEFIVRNSGDAEHPILRADWIQQVMSKWNMRSFDLRAFAIRAFANEAIVSYVQSQRAIFDNQNRDGEFFVVDLWVVNHGDWQLAARYISPVNRRS